MICKTFSGILRLHADNKCFLNEYKYQQVQKIQWQTIVTRNGLMNGPKIVLLNAKYLGNKLSYNFLWNNEIEIGVFHKFNILVQSH